MLAECRFLLLEALLGCPPFLHHLGQPGLPRIGLLEEAVAGHRQLHLVGMGGLDLGMLCRQFVAQSPELGPRILRAFGSNVNFRTQNTYSYSADASSSVTAILRPVPPPARLVPTTITVNELTQPPTVTITE